MTTSLVAHAGANANKVARTKEQIARYMITPPFGIVDQKETADRTSSIQTWLAAFHPLNLCPLLGAKQTSNVRFWVLTALASPNVCFRG